ncbi:hypothetical protein [Sphingobacterium sp.]|uniref:hypothetical protein n=1 Tax=Sphingobacterium sp. TaxID=341027 RepID=UPI0031DEDB06
MKVRLTTFARNDKSLLNIFNQKYLNNTSKWKDLQFVTGSSYDKLIILTYPHALTLDEGYDSRKSITFMTEPSVSPFAKPHETGKLLDVHLYFPFLPKEILGSIDNGGSGRNIVKSEILSTVTSELSGLKGHRIRLNFISALDKIFLKNFDVYGRSENGTFFKNLNNYKGELEDKYDGLWPYLYHFACENSFEKGYFTEKLIDPIISETFCFYSGCPDIKEYIDPRAFTCLDLNKPRESVELMIETIENNQWEKSIRYIRLEKKRFLTDLHPFNLIWSAVHEKDLTNIVRSKQLINNAP